MTRPRRLRRLSGVCRFSGPGVSRVIGGNPGLLKQPRLLWGILCF